MKIYDLYWLLIVFLIIYLIYLIKYVFRKNIKYNPDKVPQELAFLIYKYKLDMSKINYRKIMNQIGIVSAFDISVTGVFIFNFVKNTILAVILGGVMISPLIIITFDFVGKYYVKRGLIIHGNKKN